MSKLLLKISCYIGIALIIIGLLIYGVFPLIPGGPVTAIVGVILVGIYVYTNRKELRDSISVRSAKYGTNTIVFIATIFLIITLINTISGMYKLKLDTTMYKSNSLSAQTKKIISNLKNHIEILGFIPKKDTATKKTFKDFCDNYNYTSGGKITCRILDPDKHPGLAKKFHVSSDQEQVYGFQTGETYTKADTLIEEAFTSAIFRIERNIKKKIYFTKGHGEGEIVSDKEYQFSKLAMKLADLGYGNNEIFIPSYNEIPEDCSVLVLLSPKTRLMPSEIVKINNYLDKGGSVLALIDPLSDSGLEKFFNIWGLELDNDVVFDFASNSSNPIVPLVSIYQVAHPILENYKGSSMAYTYYYLARSVRAIGVKLPDINVQPLIITSGGYKYSYGETDTASFISKGIYKYESNVDKTGPLALAFVATKEIKQPTTLNETEESKLKENKKPSKQEHFAKLVLFGDSDFINNLSIDFYGNSVLALNTINWLSGDYDLISIERPSSKPNIIGLTNQTRSLIYYICLVLLPFIIILTGGILWWKKRKL